MSKIKEAFEKNWASAIIASLLVIVIAFGTVFARQAVQHSNDKNYALEIYRDNIEVMYEGARAELVENIDLFIRETAPSTCMNGLAILRECEKYNIDLFFVLAQGQLESHYGTKGLAARTNSVFNVFAYDGQSYAQINKNGKYSHPDLSIEPYIQLLKEKYLVDGKTENDLMIKYVNKDGKRYASSPTYETSLLELYNRISSNDTLQNAFQEYNKYKILSGR